MDKKNQQIQFGSAIVFLLQREYIRECSIEPAIDENGKPKLDENGNQMDRAVHPMKFSFQTWMEFHKLISDPETIIKPKNKLFKL